MPCCSPPAGAWTDPTATRLRYGKPAFLNRAFVATGGVEGARDRSLPEPFAGGGDLPEGL